MARFLDPNLPEPVLSRADTEAFLQRNNRSPGSLVAVTMMVNDPGLLQEALRVHPNDPRVQMAAALRGDYKEDRAGLLEALSNSVPENSLVDYLRAGDLMQDGDREGALEALAEADRKPGFSAYTVEAMQDIEELAMSAGMSAGEAKATAMSTVELGHLSDLRKLGGEMLELRNEYLAAGDTTSAEAMAEMTLDLAARLSVGEGSVFLIENLVGMSIENRLLDEYDPGATPALLGTSVQERRQQLAAEKEVVRELTALLPEFLVNASDAEVVSYFDRMKTGGETAALSWLQQRKPAP